MITDGTYRRDTIEKLIAECSAILESQVGIRLQSVGSQQVEWVDERNSTDRMLTRIAKETWEKADNFDMAIGFVHFNDGLIIGRIDGVFWRFIVVKELEPNLLLHEILHAFLPGKDHAKEWLMQSVRPPYGRAWYWLTPDERNEVLKNKWRDFNLVPAVGLEKKGTTKESGFHYLVGMDELRRENSREALAFLEKSVEADPDFPRALINLAWLLATSRSKELRDGRRATALALRACELTEWKSSEYLEVLAASYARTGDFSEAVKWQQKALEGMKTSSLGGKTRAWERLWNYRSGKPWPSN